MFDTPNPAGYPGHGVAMDEQDVARDLVAKLMEAVEASLEGSSAVRDALEEANWSVVEVAERLDLARSHVYHLIKAFGLEKD